MRIEETNQILKDSSVLRNDVNQPEFSRRWTRFKGDMNRRSAQARTLVGTHGVPIGVGAIVAALATGAVVVRNRRSKKRSLFRF